MQPIQTPARAELSISKNTIERVDNHVYFYADVDSDNAFKLMKFIREADTELRAQRIGRNIEHLPLTPIWLHIYSYGGDLFSGFSLADQLSLIISPVHTVIEGLCASAATLVSMSGKQRYILPSSFMLIHQLSTMVWGTHEQFKDEMGLQRKAMEKLIAFYAQRSKVSEKEIKRMLTRNYWLDATTAIEKGFVDDFFTA